MTRHEEYAARVRIWAMNGDEPYDDESIRAIALLIEQVVDTEREVILPAAEAGMDKLRAEIRDLRRAIRIHRANDFCTPCHNDGDPLNAYDDSSSPST